MESRLGSLTQKQNMRQLGTKRAAVLVYNLTWMHVSTLADPFKLSGIEHSGDLWMGLAYAAHADGSHINVGPGGHMT